VPKIYWKKSPVFFGYSLISGAGGGVATWSAQAAQARRPRATAAATNDEWPYLLQVER